MLLADLAQTWVISRLSRVIWQRSFDKLTRWRINLQDPTTSLLVFDLKDRIEVHLTRDPGIHRYIGRFDQLHTARLIIFDDHLCKTLAEPAPIGQEVRDWPLDASLNSTNRDFVKELIQ